MQQEKIDSNEKILDWRAIVHEPEKIKEDVQGLMDKIVKSISEHHDLIDEKKEEIKKTQDDANKMHGMNIKLTEGRITLDAFVELASDLGIINDEEKRTLYF